MDAETSAKRVTRRGAAADASGADLDYGRLKDLLGYHLRRAQQAAFQGFAQALAGENLSPGQLGILLVVAANPGANQTTVGNALGIDRSTLVSLLDRLQERKLLARRTSPADRRSHALVLTPTGEAYLRRLMPRVEAHEDDLARALSEEERRTLIDLLSRIRGP